MVIKTSWAGVQEASLWLQQVWAAVLSSAPSQWREDEVITGWEEKGPCETGHSSCSTDLHGEPRWRSRHESPERQRGHSGGCELESKCIRLSDAAHSVTGMAHPAVRWFMSKRNRWAGTYRETFSSRTHKYRLRRQMSSTDYTNNYCMQTNKHRNIL